jgi:hypothetical protein
MSITLTHPTAGAGNTPVVLDLPADLIWTDEFAWKQVEQSTEYTSTGALHIEAWAKQAGRPITLRGGVDYAWCLRGTLTTLNAWAAVPGLVLTLTRNTVPHTVVFDHEATAIEAQPVVPYSDPLPEDAYSLTLKFMQV